MDARPIGIFDSGVGGLTVAGAVTRALPRERVVYLGDTARLPYGNKSGDVVRRYAERCADFLLAQDIKLLIVACNTASAVALEHLEQRCSVPVLGVIRPGARAAARVTTSGRIGVLGTAGTIASGAYQRAILAERPDAAIAERACPLLVPLAEEGWVEHAATRLVVQEYLAPIKAAGVDTVVLGCTHYPLLREVLRAELGAQVTLCDSADAVTEVARALLGARELAAPSGLAPAHAFFLTDASSSFAALAERFFGAAIERPVRVDI